MLMRREKSLNDFKIGTFMAHFLSVRFDRSPSACLWGGRRKALTISKLAHLWVVVRVTAGQAWQRKGYRLTVKYSKHFKTKSLDVFISICWALSERLVAFEDHWTLKTTEPWRPLLSTTAHHTPREPVWPRTTCFSDCSLRKHFTPMLHVNNPSSPRHSAPSLRAISPCFCWLVPPSSDVQTL